MKVAVISGGAVVCGIVAGSWAPFILQALYTSLRSLWRPPVQTTEQTVQPTPQPIRASTQKPVNHTNGEKPQVPAVNPNVKVGKVGIKPTISDAPAFDDRAIYPDAHSATSILPFAILGALLGAYLGNMILDFIGRLTDRWTNMDAGDKVTVILGVVAGIVMALPFLVIFQSFQVSSAYAPWLVMLLCLGTITLSVYILQSIGEFFPWNRGRGPMRRSGIKVLDTNVIIDGRIYDVAQNGFLEGQLYVPQFVIEELQHIADHHDPLKRQRGKRGLEVLRHMQADFPLEVGIHDALISANGDPVDTRLVKLARALGADLVTNDHNLNRIAALQEVKVLNLNDLALALRPNVLPQETLMLTLIREGNQPGQGVGYLDDGTMVVVENGRNHIGETLEIEVTQVIQTERGKMIFGEVDADEEDPAEAKKRSGIPRR